MQVRAALVLLLAVACSGCTANYPQSAAFPACSAGSPQDECPGQSGGPLTVHLGATVSNTVGVALR
jgi:hypothetical protein